MFDISGLALIYSCGLMKTVPKQRHIPKTTGRITIVTINIVAVFIFPIKINFSYSTDTGIPSGKKHFLNIVRDSVILGPSL